MTDKIAWTPVAHIVKANGVCKTCKQEVSLVDDEPWTVVATGQHLYRTRCEPCNETTIWRQDP